MTISRRRFIVGSGIAASAPFIAHLLPRSPQAEPLAVATTTKDVVMKINGWDLDGEASSCGTAAIWISVGQSWRSPWR